MDGCISYVRAYACMECDSATQLDFDSLQNASVRSTQLDSQLAVTYFWQLNHPWLLYGKHSKEGLQQLHVYLHCDYNQIAAAASKCVVIKMQQGKSLIAIIVRESADITVFALATLNLCIHIWHTKKMQVFKWRQNQTACFFFPILLQSPPSRLDWVSKFFVACLC